ncbi:MAG: 3-octaprenyl-4-hydroxybenzoate carboxy-lyase [Rhodospirillaceae bacterium]|nr:3-octaprenyl-4-hydroxybenzoate carboxy-lyase [Rhodospirillaceae bacterium]|tara:strand:+ start:225 stop:821 length:597 start_codon:yes stop_codon:yes gene_type:complete
MADRLIVGMTGASGAIYGIRLLQMLETLDIEAHLVMSQSAEVALAHETIMKVSEVKALADRWYKIDDIAAAPASGSYQTLGMIITPCSMRTAGELASGVTSNLLTRAADVAIKEKRRLVLMVRETPLHSVHLGNLKILSDMGVVIAPPVPAFYTRPKDLHEMVDHSIARVLDLFGIAPDSVVRWGESVGKITGGAGGE